MKAAIYARVSTGNQTTDNQLMELQKAAEKHDWEVVKVYEETISGATVVLLSGSSRGMSHSV